MHQHDTTCKRAHSLAIRFSPLPTTAKVIELCKKHLPKIAASYDHPKARVIVGDGFKFMREHENEFDVIITDSSDPIGEGATENTRRTSSLDGGEEA